MVAKKSEDFFSRFKKYFDSAVNIVKLKPKTIGKISKDSDATLWGLLFVPFAGVATSFGAINVDDTRVLAIGIIFLAYMYFVGKTWDVMGKKFDDFFSRFKKYFDSAVNIVKLKPKTIGKISKDSDATLWGLLFVAFAGVATSFGAINVDSAVVLAAGYIIWTVFFTGILLFLARIFGGKGTFIELFRPRALGSIVYWVGAIPGIGSWLLWLSELWVLVMSVAIIKRVCKLKTAQAIIVVIVPVILVMGIVLIMLAAITAALIAAGALTI